MILDPGCCMWLPLAYSGIKWHTECCAVVGTHSTVWGDKLLYGHVPDPLPWCGIGSGHTRLACSMQNGGRRRRESYHMIFGITIRWHLLSAAKWCMRPIVHSMLATKIEQVPAESYTECMKHKHTQTKSHDSKRLLSDKCENTQQWHNHLVEQKDSTTWSCHNQTSVVKLRPWIFFTGRTYLPSGTFFLDSVASL